MNVQEREKLSFFLQELLQAQATAKDVEAERLIQEACSRQADAHYLLVQRSLLLEQALNNSQAENSRLQKELENTRGAGGRFLNDNAWGNSPAQTASPPALANAAPPTQAATVPVNNSSWGSGMLGTVATTAAGVVAGSFLFQGIEHLMGNHGSGSGSPGGNSPSRLAEPSGENLAANRSDESASAGDSGWAV